MAIFDAGVARLAAMADTQWILTELGWSVAVYNPLALSVRFGCQRCDASDTSDVDDLATMPWPRHVCPVLVEAREAREAREYWGDLLEVWGTGR
jgi:hypothetical protein